MSSLTPRRRQASVLERLFRRIATTAAVLVAATVGLVLWHPSSGQVVVVPPDEPAATAQATGGGAGVTVAAFREKLAELKLGDAVDVRENADGFLVVQGRLTSAQMRSWKKVSVWYDGVASSRPLLTSFTNAADLPEMPPIALVRLSEPKAIILRSGEVLTRRARFSGNWQVADIQRDHIVISRGKHREVLRFAGQAK